MSWRDDEDAKLASEWKSHQPRIRTSSCLVMQDMNGIRISLHEMQDKPNDNKLPGSMMNDFAVSSSCLQFANPHTIEITQRDLPLLMDSFPVSALALNAGDR
jgi:hypothetical protein